MTTFLLENFGSTVLTAACDSDDLVLQISAEASVFFPTPEEGEAFAITLWDGTNPQEICYVTENNLGVLTVTRGEEDTTPRAWLAGTQVRNFLTRDTVASILQDSFISGNKATEGQAEAGVLETVLMTPLATTQHFEARTSAFVRDEVLLGANAEAVRAALGWETATFDGTGIEDTFILPSAEWDTPYTRVYVDETFQTSGYTITGDQLIFDTPPGAGTDNIVVVLGINFAFSVSFPGNNTVTTDALVDLAVETAKLANSAVTTGKIATSAVTYSKIQNVSATDKVLGRSSSGAGNVEEIPMVARGRTFVALATQADQQTHLTSNGWPIPTGAVQAFFRASAPDGWVKANGGTIGSASSGGTLRANADTSDLFTELWNSIANTELPIQNSSGVATTRGASAAADFAANKRLPVPDLRGEFLRGLDDGRGVDAARALGSAQGDLVKAHTHTGDTDTDGVHGHPYRVRYTADSSPDGDSTGGFLLNNGAPVSTASAFTGTPSNAQGEQIGGDGSAHSHAFTTDSTGGAENRPRNVSVLWCIKL